MRRNQGAYCGERIHLDDVLAALAASASDHGWTADGMPLDGGGELPGFVRRSENERRRLYVSAGIHGDEPAGLMAVLRLIERDEWSSGDSLWICPCLNPTGFPRNTRGNIKGVDLNRDYRTPQTAEIRAHTAWLSRQPSFDMGVHLHEDWESHGFYLYELNPHTRPSSARIAIQEVAEICPIDNSAMIEGFPADHGIICPDVRPESRSEWPEAFFMVQNKTRISYTLEAPSEFPIEMRTQSLATAVTALLK